MPSVGDIVYIACVLRDARGMVVAHKHKFGTCKDTSMRRFVDSFWGIPSGVALNPKP